MDPRPEEARPDFAAELAALTRVMLAVPPAAPAQVDRPPAAVPATSTPDPLTGLMPLEPVPVLFDPIALDMREDLAPVAALTPEPAYFPALVELDTVEPAPPVAPLAPAPLDDGWNVTAPPELDLAPLASVEPPTSPEPPESADPVEEPETPRAPHVVVPTSTLIAELGFLDD